MDFGWTEEETAFRRRVRDVIEANWDDEAAAEVQGGSDLGWEHFRRFERTLAREGWLTMAWPKEYGGRGASPMEQLIFNEEAGLHDAPSGGTGVGFVGPMLMIHGTEAQKREHLPRIASAEVVWCQGFSEPGAGSDLASLQTRAVREGDEFVINGQKIWTSKGHRADWMHVLTRTDVEAPKHRGISYFILNMRTPGVTVRPLPQIHGVANFNETFFEDVRVPASNMIGEQNRGWYVATTLLDFERSAASPRAAAERGYRRLLDYARGALNGAGAIANGGAARLRLVDLGIELEVSRWLSYRVAWMQGQGMVPNQEASIAKVFNSELHQRLYRAGVNLLGLFGGLRRESRHSRLDGHITHQYMDSVARTIGAGTSEIQRNIIATRGLGLPRS
jgi:alkylation response protein AidB-like acyl-CoA dehydrogenase